MILPMAVFSAVSTAFAATIRALSRRVTIPAAPPRSDFEFVFLGTGVSTALPRISCIIDKRLKCEVCEDGNKNPLSKNRRCNVSAVVRVGNQCILFDCGKTTREAMLRWAPQYGIDGIDAVILTHPHADAILGLDDLRDMQRQNFKVDEQGKKVGPTSKDPIPVYLNKETMDGCISTFPYLLPQYDGVPQSKCRRVSKIDWTPFKEDEYYQSLNPLKGADVNITPIPLWHGKDYVCMGYIIRSLSEESGAIIAYLSDVSEVPEKTMEALKALEKIDLLVVDALQQRAHFTHFSLDQAVDLAKELRPQRTLMVGMSCEMGMHEEVNRELAKLKESDGLQIALAHDGLLLPM